MEAVITTSHAPARTTPPAPPPAEEQETASSATACELMRQATGTHFLPPLQVHQVGQLVTEFGPAAVEAAIREASASNTRGKPSISFVRAIAARVASGAPKPVPPERTARETGPPRHFGEPGRTVMKEWVDDPAFATEGGT